MQTIKITSHEREQMLDVTDEVRKIVREQSAAEGLCFLFVQHTTCALTINENADSDVQVDMVTFLRKLVPQDGQNFRHFELNSDAHIKSSFIGSSVIVPFADGELLLGRWQGIYLCEFDGPKERSILVSIK